MSRYLSKTKGLVVLVIVLFSLLAIVGPAEGSDTELPEELNNYFIVGTIGISIDYLFENPEDARSRINEALEDIESFDEIFVNFTEADQFFRLSDRRDATADDVAWILANLEGLWDSEGEWLPWPPFDKEMLLDLITDAQNLKDGTGVGDEPGEASQEAHDAFQESIDAAQAVYDDPDATQEDIIAALDALQAAKETFEAALQEIPYPQVENAELKGFGDTAAVPGVLFNNEWTFQLDSEGRYDSISGYLHPNGESGELRADITVTFLGDEKILENRPTGPFEVNVANHLGIESVKGETLIIGAQGTVSIVLFEAGNRDKEYGQTTYTIIFE